MSIVWPLWFAVGFTLCRFNSLSNQTLKSTIRPSLDSIVNSNINISPICTPSPHKILQTCPETYSAVFAKKLCTHLPQKLKTIPIYINRECCNNLFFKQVFLVVENLQRCFIPLQKSILIAKSISITNPQPKGDGGYKQICPTQY